ncbi:MAG: flagellar biosynthetic protein FliO [Bacteroidetes bacterium]|nr:flagellar biosynthetic protein FliO [Bacteroidota bacterium]
MIDETLLRAFLTLLLCVAALGVVLFIVKRYSSKIAPQRTSLDLKAIGRLPLHKGAVYAIQVGNRTLLIGATEHSINLLTDITEDQTQVLPNTSHIDDTHSIAIEPSSSLSFGSFIQSIAQRPKQKNGNV